jgi:hypothetical protein
MPARPFNAVALLILGDRGRDIWGFHPVVTPVGVALQVAVTLAWGLVFVRLAGGARGLRLAAAALFVAATALALHVFVATLLARADVADVLVPAQVIALHVVLGIALPVGMRLATSHLWTD